MTLTAELQEYTHDRTGVIVAQPLVTLVEGSSFCVTGPSGDMDPRRADGLFVRDTRIISGWSLHLDGAPVDPLTVIPGEPYECTFVGRASPRAGNPNTTVVVERHRLVGQGMREDITLRNFGTEPAGVQLAIRIGADFADLFQVKEQRIATLRSVARRAAGEDLTFWVEEGIDRRGVRVSAPDGRASDDTVFFTAVVPAQGDWSTTVEVVPSVGGDELTPTFPIGRPVENAIPAARMRGWRASAPRFEIGNPVLATALDWSQRDLGALRIVDPDYPDDEVVAAGAPWFMALFGRDSLLTSIMTLPYLPELARGTLNALARMQGSRSVPITEEQPGRILHEVRGGADPWLALGGESVYFGSIDSTPLFVVLVGELVRWGAAREEYEPLLPAVDRALAWIAEYGDRDGDGFVEYRRQTDKGLAHQGWKDSQDGIPFDDGRQALPPIATAEVQGYCYAAYVAKADIDLARGDRAGHDEWLDRAAQLKRHFHESFWMPDRGYYALALDRDKRQVDAVASNAGQCLWSGIVDDDAAPLVAAHLLSPAMFTGFGVRTLSAEAATFNPVSYHNGSVWPHDSMLVAAGLRRYGFAAESAHVSQALLVACDELGGTLPELFCGFAHSDKRVPVPYPTSCSPQAWAAAVPFQLLSTALNLRADVVRGVFGASPVPGFVGEVTIDGLELAGHEVSIRADAAEVQVTGLPPGMRFERSDGGARSGS